MQSLVVRVMIAFQRLKNADRAFGMIVTNTRRVRFFLYLVIPICLLTLLGWHGSKSQVEKKFTLTSPIYSSGLFFEENIGQVDPSFLFRLRSTEHQITLLLKKGGVVFGLNHLQAENRTILMSWTSANSDVKVEGLNKLRSTTNYFMGKDSNAWAAGIRNFGQVVYRNLYSGVDVLFYETEKELEHDYVVHPGADPSAIRMRFQGFDSVKIDQNDRLVLISSGKILLKKPVAYQIYGDLQKEVSATYRMNDHGEIQFNLGTFDPKVTLVIDPVIDFSSYLGGNQDEVANAIAVDPNGFSYITGYTESANLPIKKAFQPNRKVLADVFISKFSPSGDLMYSTYLGGNGTRDEGFAIAVDKDGNAYVTGQTSSTNFPIRNALQSTLKGTNNAFVTKLSPDGSKLVFSSYLGGSTDETGTGVAVDANRNVYLVGATSSPDFPVIRGFQNRFGGFTDAFVAKLNPEGTALIYSSYLGGSFDDLASAIAVDRLGNVYVAGSTGSTNFPTRTPFQAKKRGAAFVEDSFVTKVNRNGTSLLYSTYLGGSSPSEFEGRDIATGIAVDSSGSAYVTGYTNSPSFPVLHASQTTNKNNSYDLFVTRFAPSGKTLKFSTYLGGSGFDTPGGIVVDSLGNAYVAGRVDSVDFPQIQSMQTYNNGLSTGEDAFITKLSPMGTFLLSSYLGGRFSDIGTGVAIDLTGNIYVTGYTDSDDFPLVRAYQSTKRGALGSQDAFVARVKQ